MKGFLDGFTIVEGLTKVEITVMEVVRKCRLEKFVRVWREGRRRRIWKKRERAKMTVKLCIYTLKLGESLIFVLVMYQFSAI